VGKTLTGETEANLKYGGWFPCRDSKEAFTSRSRKLYPKLPVLGGRINE